jgi:hypothetical protein
MTEATHGGVGQSCELDQESAENRDVSQPEILGPGFREPSGRYRVTSPVLDQYGMEISFWLILTRNFHD